MGQGASNAVILIRAAKYIFLGFSCPKVSSNSLTRRFGLDPFLSTSGLSATTNLLPSGPYSEQ